MIDNLQGRDLRAGYDLSQEVYSALPIPVQFVTYANLQSEWIPLRYGVVPAITIQIVPALESNWIWLEETADVGGVKAVT